MNKNVFRQLSYGVYVISTWDNGRATGCTANSAMQITSEPATIAVSINHNNYTNQCIQESGRFAISILGENTNPGVIGTFGFKSGRDCNKFEEVEQTVKGFMPVVADACAYAVCEVIDKMETETHTVFLGKVVDADVLKSDTPMTYAVEKFFQKLYDEKVLDAYMLKNDTPMTYAYYHNVIKGKSPKNAPTYIAE